MNKPLSLIKKIIIVLCVIALLATCITISAKYVLHKRMNELLETIKDDEVLIDDSVANDIKKVMQNSRKIDSYEECFLSAILSEYNGDYEGAIAYCESGVQYAKTDLEKADLYRKIGIITSQQCNYEIAVDALNSALEYNPDDKNALLYKAECFLQLGNYSTALNIINKYKELYDLTSDQYETVMTMYVAIGEYEGIIDTANDAMEKYPEQENNFLLYRMQGNILKDDLDAARMDAQQYLTNSENQTDVDVLIASYSYALQKYDLALQLYLDFIYNKNEYSYIETAIECSYQIDDYDTMLKLSEDALAYYKDDEQTSYYKWEAIALMQKGQYAKAIADFDKYLDAYTDQNEIYYLRALCNFTEGNYNDAVSDFTVAINEDSLAEDGLYNRALCYIQLDDLDNALSDLQAVVDLRGNGDTYASALELLELLNDGAQTAQ